MKTAALACFIVIFGSWSARALSPGERGLLGEVLDACGSVTQWSTFSTKSTFHRRVEQGGRLKSVEDETTAAQLQKEPRGNYATYIKASRRESEVSYQTGWYSVQEDVLRLEIMQGGDFLLKVLEASEKYFGSHLKSMASGWFKPSNQNFRGRLPIGGEFADHVSLGVSKPMNLRESDLEGVKEVSDKDFDGTKARCIRASFKPHHHRDSQARSMTFCFSGGKLIEVIEKIDAKPEQPKGQAPIKIESIAVRTYTDVNMAVDFPFQPAPFALPRGKRIARAEEEQENPLLPSTSIRSFWIYLLVCGVGLTILAVIVSFISYSQINSLWARGEEEPLLRAGTPARAPHRSSSSSSDNDGPPLLV